MGAVPAIDRPVDASSCSRTATPRSDRDERPDDRAPSEGLACVPPVDPPVVPPSDRRRAVAAGVATRRSTTSPTRASARRPGRRGEDEVRRPSARGALRRLADEPIRASARRSTRTAGRLRCAARSTTSTDARPTGRGRRGSRGREVDPTTRELVAVARPARRRVDFADDRSRHAVTSPAHVGGAASVPAHQIARGDRRAALTGDVQRPRDKAARAPSGSRRARRARWLGDATAGASPSNGLRAGEAHREAGRADIPARTLPGRVDSGAWRGCDRDWRRPAARPTASTGLGPRARPGRGSQAGREQRADGPHRRSSGRPSASSHSMSGSRAEPGALALGERHVAPRVIGDRRVAGQRAVENAQRLAIADRARTRAGAGRSARGAPRASSRRPASNWRARALAIQRAMDRAARGAGRAK